LVFVQNKDISTTHVIPWTENSYRRLAALIARRGVPYDFVVIEKGLNAAQLARYKVLVAPEISLLSDTDAKVIREYVSAGGHLLSIGPLGDSTITGEEHVARSPALLTEWTGVKSGDAYWEKSLGLGAIAFVPAAIIGDSEKSMAVTSDFKQGARYTGLGSQLELKSSITIEATIRAKQSERFIHLVRLGPSDGAGDVPASFDYSLPPNVEVASVETATPNTSATLGATWSVAAPGKLRVDLKRLEPYAIVHVTIRQLARTAH
jgi:hypothetical protein